MVHENHFINAFEQRQNACSSKQHACANKSLSVDGHLYTIWVNMDNGHGHAPAQRHKHRRLSTQQTHYIAGDKTVNYNKKRQILNTLTKTRTIFIYLEIGERLNLYPNWMFSWLHCHVVSLITLVFHWSRLGFLFVQLPGKFVQFHLLLLSSMSITAPFSPFSS